MNTLIQRLEITAEELEDKNLKPMAATVREVIKALSDNSSERQVDAGVRLRWHRKKIDGINCYRLVISENYHLDVEPNESVCRNSIWLCQNGFYRLMMYVKDMDVAKEIAEEFANTIQNYLSKI